jgi:hypothetical protein
MKACLCGDLEIKGHHASCLLVFCCFTCIELIKKLLIDENILEYYLLWRLKFLL